MTNRRNDNLSTFFWMLTLVGIIVVWWRLVARLAYRFGVRYYQISFVGRLAWQALWILILYAAIIAGEFAIGAHPFG